MYPELQSAFLAEASAPLILLGGAVLLYRSFRETYLLPWIAGWGVYTLAKLFLAVSQAHGLEIWLALANVSFAGAVTLFAGSIFYYVYRPRILIQASLLIFPAMLLGVFQALSPGHSHVLGFFFGICCLLLRCISAWQLFVFARGRGNTGAWILTVTFPLLLQDHPKLAYGILVDVLLGISMMMIVLDESRVQNWRLDILNRLSQVVSGADDFLAIANTTLAELMKVFHADAAWFRILEEGKLRIAVQQGLPEALVSTIYEIDAMESTSGRLLRQGEVGAVRSDNMVPSVQQVFAEHGIDHIVVVPVIGKNSRIGVLVLSMRRHRYYTDQDRTFLKAAANQLGLAAENRRLVQQLVCSVHDLTETKAAEERYKTLFDHMQEGVFVSSPDGHILDCNQAFVQMMGFATKEELLRVNVSETLYLNAEDRQRFLTEMERHGFVRNFEINLQRKDGRQITLIESSFATRNPDGTDERYQGVVLDITEKKMTENEIRRRNRELSALHTIAVSFNESFDLDESLQIVLAQIAAVFGTETAALYLFDKDRGIFHMQAMHGYRNQWPAQARELAVPTEVLDSIRSEHTELIKSSTIVRSPALAHIVAAEGLRSSLGIVLWRKDEILGALGTSSRSEHEFGAEDITMMVALGRQLATTIDRIKLYEETRKAYDDLRRTQEQLLQSEKMSAVGRLISGVAHELNNPLTAISGYTQLLESENTEPRVHEFVRKLQKQTDRAMRIVQNLLSFARQHRPQRIYVDLRNVMEDTIALRDYELKTHNIVLEREFEEGLPAVVADPHQLEQVFLNIINNAVDAILDTGRSGLLTIRIFTEYPNVVCEFHDSGPGMADPKHVFDPFYTTKGVGKGTGLGLSICYGIVKEHGGEITAFNHVDGGAVIQVRLPENLGAKPMSEGERILARREAQVHGRVLLLDGEDVLEFEREVLSTAGLDVVALNCGNTAIEQMKQSQFDILLLDSEANSTVNGAAVLQWIREACPEMIARTVLMLAPVDHSSPRSFVNDDRFQCFVKPFEAASLLGVIRRVLRASRAAVGD